MIAHLNRWRQRQWHQWLDRRIPVANGFELNHGNIFIFPSAFGMTYIAICAMLFLLGVNYQNTLITLLSYGLVAVLITSLLTSYFNFKDCAFRLGKVQPGHAGETMAVPVWIEQRQKRGNIHFGFVGNHPSTSVDLDQHPGFVTVPHVSCVRGCHPLPRLKIQSYYPLGLVRCWTYLTFNGDLWVYPAPLKYPLVAASNGSGKMSSAHSVRQPGPDDFEGLRSYQSGDPLRHVAWKHLAKGQGMLSKTFTSQCNSALWLRLSDMATDDPEDALSQLCFGVLTLEKEGISYGLDLPGTLLNPGGGPDHQRACLQALAVFKGHRGV